jgi:hypothetical protein
MKRALLLASIIGLFMVTAVDLQARHRRIDQSRQGRSGISFGFSSHSQTRDRTNGYGRYDDRSGRHARSGISFGLVLRPPLLDRYNGYGSYGNYPGRHVASEIRRNEKRIWKLEKKMEKLYRYGGDYREIRELEQEINYLQRRNDFLRYRRY